MTIPSDLRFSASLDAAVARGHLLAEDRGEILRTAEISFSRALTSNRERLVPWHSM